MYYICWFCCPECIPEIVQKCAAVWMLYLSMPCFLRLTASHKVLGLSQLYIFVVFISYIFILKYHKVIKPKGKFWIIFLMFRTSVLPPFCSTPVAVSTAIPSHDIHFSKLAARLHLQLLPQNGPSQWLNNLTRKTYVRSAKENRSGLVRILLPLYSMLLVRARTEMVDSHT